MFIVYTILVVTALSLLALGVFLWMFRLAKQDVHFTELAPDTGKMVAMGKDVVEILFNSSDGHYKEDGAWVTGEQDLGIWFELTHRVFFGISPIYEIRKFDTSWSDYAEGEDEANGKKGPPHLVPRKTTGHTTFKRFYSHAVKVVEAEMAEEGAKNSEGTSTTLIDAVMLITFEITNIKDAVFRIPPEGIIFSQADAALQGAFNDYVKDKRWEDFHKEPKLAQNSKFVEHIKDTANPVLMSLGIGMKINVVELKYHELSPGPGNEALDESRTLLAIARNKGEAIVALSESQKLADKLDGEGKRDRLLAVKEAIGENAIGEYANLEQVKGTQLRVYGPSNAVPVIDTDNKQGKES